MVKSLLILQVIWLMYFPSLGQSLPTIESNSKVTKTKTEKKAKPLKDLTPPKIHSIGKQIDGYYEYYTLDEGHLYSGLLKNGKPNGYAFIYSKLDTSIIFEGQINDQDDISRKIEENTKGYEYYLEKGESALKQDHKPVAINSFKKVKTLLGNKVSQNTKCKEIITSAISNGDKFAGVDEYKTALSWYLIAQSLDNSKALQNKINQCKSKL
ncbi:MULTISPECIES: hypothetical protein [Flectobacillus]|uniref:hypothetical protein n=1 Tax=Flectobacillus TaxID=101 RepID=UPI000BA33637|nr:MULTISPECIES: hypothetical protein [Flectobacillus]MDI9872303.1 hypothetical protein [Flectobacillus roseus]PAC28872.1 hypothetical protein BWI92_17725 [Flectobacillus sp. BAB-3569]